METGIQWPLVLFTVIAGAGGGLLAITGVARLVGKQAKSTRQIGLVCALVLLVIGGLMSVFHLSHPERFMGALANLFSFSGIALELIGLMLGGLVIVLFFAFSAAEKQIGEKILAVCAIGIGIIAPFLQGYAYFEVTAQPGWHSLALPFSYLLTSLTTGALMYAVIASFKKEDKTVLQLVGKIAAGLAVLAAIATVIYVAILYAAGLLVSDAMVTAILAIAFNLAALGLAAWFAAKPSLALAIGGVLCGVCGGIAVRVLMWAISTYGLSLLWEATANRGLYLFS